MPEVNDEVLLAFDHGDVRFPYVVGFMWNGQDQPPANDLQLRMIRSVNGHEIRLYDPPVQNGNPGYIRIQYSRGGGSINIVELANGGITISSDSAVQIVAPNVMINGRVVAPTSGSDLGHRKFSNPSIQCPRPRSFPVSNSPICRR